MLRGEPMAKPAEEARSPGKEVPVSLYTFVVFLHITAAVLLLSTSIVGEPLVRAAARRTRSPQELRSFLELGRPMASLALPAALGVLATGVYLSSVGRFWTLGWVQASAALWLVNSVVAGAVVRRAVGRLEAGSSAVDDPVIGPDLDALRWAGSWSWGGDVLATNDAVMLALMTLRPSLGASLLLVLVANGLVAGGRRILGPQGPGHRSALPPKSATPAV